MCVGVEVNSLGRKINSKMKPRICRGSINLVVVDPPSWKHYIHSLKYYVGLICVVTLKCKNWAETKSENKNLFETFSTWTWVSCNISIYPSTVSLSTSGLVFLPLNLTLTFRSRSLPVSRSVSLWAVWLSREGASCPAAWRVETEVNWIVIRAEVINW